MAKQQVGGPVSAAVAFVHAHHLVLVPILTGRLEAFHVAQDQPIIRQACLTPPNPKKDFFLFAVVSGCSTGVMSWLVGQDEAPAEIAKLQWAACRLVHWYVWVCVNHNTCIGRSCC